MKKISFVLLALSISVMSLAQDSIAVANQSQGSGDWDNEFYFRFAYSQATSSYFGVDEEDFWDIFDKVGGTFELGHIFIINRAALSDGVRLGINVDYAEFSYQQFTNTEVDMDVVILKLASKIGPSLTFSPANKLYFDAFVKARIPWVGGIGVVSDELDEVFLAKPGIGIATGINVRYRFLMLGFEYNSDKMKYESEDYPGAYFGDVGSDSEKTPMSSLSFSLGFYF